MGPRVIVHFKPSFCVGAIFLSFSLISTAKATSTGSCFRIRYESENGCDHLLKTGISRDQCCTGHYRRAWSPPNASPTLSQGHGRQGHSPDEAEGASNSASHTPAWLQATSFPFGHNNPHCQPCTLSCDGVRCGEDKECVLRNGLPKCVCSPKCYLQHKSAVCGTDGRTYSSECQLLKRSCRKKKQVYVEHSGPCQTCNGVKCKKKRTCILDELLTPQCTRCPLSCSESKKKVRYICGTDGITYGSKCLLKIASCKARKTISKAYKGPCREEATCEDVKCWRGETCLQRIAHRQPQCLWCGDLRDCPATITQICASDGNIYQSWCALRHASCRSRIALSAIPLHYCTRNESLSMNKMNDECLPTPDITSIINNRISLAKNSDERDSHKDISIYLERLKTLEQQQQTQLENKGNDHRMKLNKSKMKRKKKGRECP